MGEHGIANLTERLEWCENRLKDFDPLLVEKVSYDVRMTRAEDSIKSILTQRRVLNMNLEDKKHRLRLARDPEYKSEFEHKENIEKIRIHKNNIEDLKDDLETCQFISYKNDIIQRLNEQRKILIKYEQPDLTKDELNKIYAEMNLLEQ